MVDILQWKQHRTKTTNAFALIAVTLGVEYSMTFVTLWLYLRTLVVTEYPYVFYSVISAAYFVSSIMSSLVVSRLFDRYRCTRLLFFLCTVLIVVGNVLYTLHFSPYLLVLGRIVSGIGGALRPIMQGEIARCYDETEVVAAFSKNALGFSFGFVVGPAVNFGFTHIDWQLGAWHLTYANFVGIFMSAVFMIVLLIVHFGVYDLSREFDLKMESKVENRRRSLESSHHAMLVSSGTGVIRSSAYDFVRHNSITIVEEDDEESPLVKTKSVELDATPTVLGVGKALVCNFDTFCLLLFSYVSMFVMLSFDMWSPLIIVETLGWGVLEVNAVMFGSGFWACVLLVVLLKNPPPAHYNLLIGLVGFATIAFMEFLIVAIIKFHSNLPVVVVGWILYGIGFAFIALVEEVFLVSTMALFIPSNVQSFAESLRQTMSRAGSITALMIAGVVFKHLVLVCSVLMAVMLVMIGIMVVRRRQLRHPTQIKM